MIQFRSKKYQEKYQQNMIPELSLVSKQEEKQDNLRLLSQSDNEELYFKAWEHLDENVKKRLSTELWQDRLTLLTHDYTRKNITEQVKVLETLAYIHTKEAVDFLVEALKSRDEILRLNAAAALKKQDPLLILEPMIDALTKPEVFLAARVYDVLSETGALLVPLLLQKLPASDANAKTVMIQLLGAFGDESVCCSIYAAAEGENTSVRKAAAESYAALGGEKSGEYLSRALTDPDWQIRLAAVQGLKKLKYRKAAPLIKKALARESDTVVQNLMRSLLSAWDNGEIIEITAWKRQ